MKQLELQNVSLELNKASILQNISVSLKRGEMVGLIGPNGAGKSSLLKSTLGLIETSNGKVIVDGQELLNLSLKERARKIAYAAQGAPVYWPLTVKKIVALGRVPFLNPWQKLSAEDSLFVENAMQETDCWHLKERVVTTLSGGERARVLLARVLATKAPYVLADEPVASLDPSHQLQVMDILKKLSNSDCGVMVVMHDLSLALRYCDKLILLNEGKLIGQDIPAVILNDDNLENIFSVRASRWQDNNENFLVTHHINKGN